jgi:ribosomal protein S11
VSNELLETKKIKRICFLSVTFALLLLVLAVPVQSSIAPPTGFNSFFYTPDGAILFSYDNNTYFVVKDSSGGISWNGTLDKGATKQLTLGDGTYSVSASKPYTLIVGNPQTQNVVGYFALDAKGKGTSKDLYTYIPPPDPLYVGGKFLVFAYENDTDVTVTDVDTKVILWQGALNASQHFSQDLSNVTWQNRTVNVGSTWPVSVLCYLDQGFVVPSSTGLFTGTLFYTFASNITNGDNDLNVVGYHNNTWVNVTNTVTRALIWNGTLNAGEVHSEVFANPTYLTVESNQSVAVTVDPYPTWMEGYQAGLYVADINGNLVGNQFYSTARGEGSFNIPGYLRILAYQDNTHIAVTDETTHVLIWNGTLDAMQSYKSKASHTIYKIDSDKPVSVMEGYWEPTSVAFAPIHYTIDTQPPIIGVPSNSPQNPMATQDVQVTVDVVDDVSGVQMVILSHSHGAFWQNVTMTWSGGNTYTAKIPTLPSQTLMQYKIIAYDNVNNTATSSQTTLSITPQPSPSPSPSPTPSPSPSPTPNPSPSPSPPPTQPPSKPFKIEPFSALLIVAGIVIVALVAMGLRLYFRKRNK